MSVFKLHIDHIVTTRVEVEIDARTKSEAETAARRAVLPQSAYDPHVKSLKRRSKVTKLQVIDPQIFR